MNFTGTLMRGFTCAESASLETDTALPASVERGPALTRSLHTK